MKSVSRHETGVAKITFIVFAAIIGTVVWSAFKIFPFFYYNQELRNYMQNSIKIASMESDQEIRNRLEQAIARMEIPVDPKKLQIMRTGRHMRISIKYQEVFYVTWQGKEYDLRTFDFDTVVEGNF